MKMDSNTKMNASMKDQYVDRFFEAVINGNEDTVRQLLKGTMQKSTDLIMLTLTQSPPSDFILLHMRKDRVRHPRTLYIHVNVCPLTPPWFLGRSYCSIVRYTVDSCIPRYYISRDIDISKIFHIYLSYLYLIWADGWFGGSD